MTAETPETPAAQPDPAAQRLSFWESVDASSKYIRESVKSEGDNIRKSDPVSVWMVPFAIIVLVFATLMGTVAKLVVGLLAYLTVIYYLLSRIGIVRGMTHRQTNMVWHMLMASFTAGLLFAFIYLEFLRLISPVQPS